MKQKLSGNKQFIKKTVIPLTRKVGIKKITVKEIPATYTDDKDQIEIEYDVDDETNDIFLDLLKKKAGNKGTAKRKMYNLTVLRELIYNMLREELITEADIKVSSKRELQKALKLAFNEMYKGKIPTEIYRGDTGEYIMTVEKGSRGTLVEFDPDGIADAVREFK